MSGGGSLRIGASVSKRNLRDAGPHIPAQYSGRVLLRSLVEVLPGVSWMAVLWYRLAYVSRFVQRALLTTVIPGNGP